LGYLNAKILGILPLTPTTLSSFSLSNPCKNEPLFVDVSRISSHESSQGRVCNQFSWSAHQHGQSLSKLRASVLNVPLTLEYIPELRFFENPDW